MDQRNHLTFSRLLHKQLAVEQHFGALSQPNAAQKPFGLCSSGLNNHKWPKCLFILQLHVCITDEYIFNKTHTHREIERE